MLHRLLIALVLVVTPALGEVISVRGMGEATTKAPIGKPTDDEKAEARRKAAFDAIDRALRNQSDALRQQFNERSEALRSVELQAFIKNQNVQYSNDPKAKKVTALLSGDLDLSAMKDSLNQMPKAKTQAVLSNAEVALFFTVRETSENIVSTRESAIARSDAKNKEVEANQKAGDSGVSTQETALLQKRSSVSETETTKADVQKYRLDAASREAFGSALQSQFSDKGFRQIVDGAMFDTAQVLDAQFGSGDVVPAKVWRALTDDVRQAEPSVQFVIIGTLDFSIPTKDPISGMPKLTGTVTGKIYQLGGAGLPRLVAALQPVTQAAAAGTQQDAKKRVLSALGPMAADEIITKLKNKGAL